MNTLQRSFSTIVKKLLLSTGLITVTLLAAAAICWYGGFKSVAYFKTGIFYTGIAYGLAGFAIYCISTACHSVERPSYRMYSTQPLHEEINENLKINNKAFSFMLVLIFSGVILAVGQYLI